MAIFTLLSPIDEFEPLWIGTKKADWRKYNGYSEGDVVDILEYDHEHARYTGRWLRATISHIQQNTQLGIPKIFCILSLDIQKRMLLSSAQIKRLNKIGVVPVKPIDLLKRKK